MASVAVLGALQVLIAGCGGGGGSGTSHSAPAITAQPADAAVLTDATATFTVAANGDGLAYQWQKDGAPITGATAASYTTPAAGFADSGAAFTVVVSNASGSVTSTVAHLALKLSANQQIYEDLVVGPNGGTYQAAWNLAATGPQTVRGNYAFTDFAVLAKSPLTHGTQKALQSLPANLTKTLALPAESGPQRVLKDGVVLVVPNWQATSATTYVGEDVQVDGLAADNVTVAYSAIRSHFAVFSLTGAVAAAPAGFVQSASTFYLNPANFDPAAQFSPGSQYVTFTAVAKGDRYMAFDCRDTTLDANISPCLSGTTVTSALTAGIPSASDGVTYHLGDGNVSLLSGVPVWVATTPRPLSATFSAQVQYRIYFEMNGNVYTGALTRDGTLLGGPFFLSNPAAATILDSLTFTTVGFRMNKAARDSFAAALTF